MQGTYAETGGQVEQIEETHCSWSSLGTVSTMTRRGGGREEQRARASAAQREVFIRRAVTLSDQNRLPHRRSRFADETKEWERGRPKNYMYRGNSVVSAHSFPHCFVPLFLAFSQIYSSSQCPRPGWRSGHRLLVSTGPCSMFFAEFPSTELV